MSVRFVIDGFGQVELNNAAFRRDGRIEAQCKLDPEDFEKMPAENGMLLAVDRVNRVVKLPTEEDTLIALNYSAEHLYDERAYGLKNFKLELDDYLPRLGYLSRGDKFTSNCISYDFEEFDSDEALMAAGQEIKDTPLYGGIDTELGSILVSKNEPAAGPKLLVVEATTMPDGQFAFMFQVL
jgi:hypothetical protein